MNTNPGRAKGPRGSGEPGIRVVRLASVGSTNREAERLVRDAAHEDARPVFVVAEIQTQGEGRRATAGWASPPGGLWATLAWPLGADDHALDGLGLRLGIACLRTVGSAAGREVPQLKWPNDILLGGRKVCGCMARVLAPNPGDRRWILAAAGINANNEIPPELRAAATSLSEASGRMVDLGALEERLREELCWAVSTRGLGDALVGEASSALAGVGEPIRLREANATIEGTLLGLGPRGTPRVRTADGVIEAGPAAETARDA